MTVLCLVAVSAFLVGLYSGRRRAEGMGWMSVARDMSLDACRAVKSAWIMVASLFRKGDKRGENPCP